ncbi:YfaZ family outer membrane protein [Marinagarivorans cellulosilyticus]|uniref:YfaZ n=1 Tax=Marinagarivorans cellulosilyticus TaxID=2721545 RepID=A0AAN1WF92_9GAMM|nr:YfaZ family outer membrane protein [Marinagarivorans cellulosilyticus]BCD96517.1 hypothetical protein MARGE09_P0717 [Marinagarivorans cellulosilyticus]
MLKFRRLATAILSSITSVSSYASSELNLALSSDVVAIDYANTHSERGSQWGFGALYNDPNNASQAFVSFNVIGESQSANGLQTGLGLKLVVHDTFQTAGSLALGGKARYEPEAWSGFGLEGSAYFAPSMLNTNDAKQYFEVLARLTYSVNPQARFFVGLQSINIKYDEAIVSKVKMNKGANIGFTLTF